MKNIRRHILNCKIAGMVCMLAFFSGIAGRAVHAAENTPIASDAAVVSSRTTEDGIYIYIKGVSRIMSGTTAQIGNTLCEDIQVAAVASMGIPVRTTILIDNSLSISERWGSQTKELIKGLIDSHAEGEEFKIATFSDSLTVVSDFSTDYELLKTAADGITFVRQESYLTDILYDLLKQDEDSGEANYTRFIIITDGADDKDIKYTQSELTDLMKNGGVVIHAVGVKVSTNNALLENLFSYARLTGGTYKMAERNTAAADVKDMVNGDLSLLCMKLTPAADIMDGGRKEAKLTLNTPDGEIVLRASLQMPFADVSSMPAGTVEPSASPVPSPAPEKPELPSIAVQTPQAEVPQETGQFPIIPVIAVGVAALVVIVILVILLILKGRKTKKVDVLIADSERTGAGAKGGEQEPSIRSSDSPQPGVAPQAGGNTARLGRQEADAGRTMRLQGGAGQAAARQSYITLTDINNPQRSFRVPIDTRIVIGRETGDIVLGHDASVSYSHCEIVKKGNLFYVNDLKSSNGTFYGNMRVYNETPIMSGGILEIGANKYKITIEN